MANSGQDIINFKRWRNPDKTLPEDAIDLWRRLRKGKSRYTIAFFLIVSGVAITSPPWWQPIVEKILDAELDLETQTSLIQQILGLIIIILGIVVFFGRNTSDR